MKKTLLLFLELSLLLIFANSCSAQNYTTYYLTAGVWAGNVGSDPMHTLLMQLYGTPSVPLTWNLPDTNGTSGQVLTSDGGYPVANLAWAYPTTHGGDSLYYILNQNSHYQTANFEISGNGTMNGNLIVGGTGSIGTNLTVGNSLHAVNVYISDSLQDSNLPAAGGAGFGFIGTNGDGTFGLEYDSSGYIPIGNTATGNALLALPIAGRGITITPGANTLTIATHDTNSDSLYYILNQNSALQSDPGAIKIAGSIYNGGNDTVGGSFFLSGRDSIGGSELVKGNDTVGTNLTVKGWENLGIANTISGTSTATIGDSNTVSNTGAVAIGSNNTSNALDAFSIGGASNGNTASAINSFAGGQGCVASAINSFAFGAASTSSGGASFAFGAATASAGYACAMGYFVTASGAASAAFGENATTNAKANSFVWGDNSAATSNDASSQFMVRASGGYKLFATSGATPDVQLDNTNHLTLDTATSIFTSSNAGILGQLLESQGAGTCPKWITPEDGETDSVGMTAAALAVSSMEGFKVFYTPVRTGRVHVVCSGTISTPGGTASVILQFGTGSAPVHGVPLAGTAVGSARAAGVGAGTPSAFSMPFPCTGIITGLALGTAIWVDCYAVPPIASTVTVSPVDISIAEF